MNSYTVSPEDASPDDVDALTELVAVIQQVQRTEDTDGFLALFDADAVWVTGAGSRLVGLDVIADFTRQVLPGAMVDGSVTYDVDHIPFHHPEPRADRRRPGVHRSDRRAPGSPLARPPDIRLDAQWEHLADRRRTEHDLHRRPVIACHYTHASAALHAGAGEHLRLTASARIRWAVAFATAARTSTLGSSSISSPQRAIRAMGRPPLPLGTWGTIPYGEDPRRQLSSPDPLP